MTENKDPPLFVCDGVYFCGLCLTGEGGECHSPGCIMFLSTAPDLPIGEKIVECGGKIRLLDRTINSS